MGLHPREEALGGMEREARVADLKQVPRWLATMAARPAVALAMTRYEGSAIRVGRDVEAPLD